MIYHISGSGDPVVFLHGIYLGGLFCMNGRKSIRTSTFGREVIVPDLIGFGESERPGVTMDATDYAESLAEFLRNTCGDRTPDRRRKRPDCRASLLLVLTAPEARQQAHPSPANGSEGIGKMGASGMVTLVGLPGLNRFVYRNYLSRAPFIRGWLTKFALGDPSRAE